MIAISEAKYTAALGREIKARRKAKKLSRNKLATLSQMHRNTLNRYEDGDDIPMLSFLRICAALQVYPGDVLRKVFTEIKEATG
jgi:transcriptional regulator with XRE-family HTH domain